MGGKVLSGQCSQTDSEQDCLALLSSSGDKLLNLFGFHLYYEIQIVQPVQRQNETRYIQYLHIPSA